jgi:DNA repair protein RadC
MYPSEVRERILGDHERLHALLCALETSVDGLERDASQLGTVVQIARSLLEEFVVHTELEDSILGDALCDIDAWGPVRAQRLHEHHEAQRSELRSLLENYGQIQSQNEIVRVTQTWIRELRSDMHHEETDILTRTLLRDDPISVGMESG